MYLAICKTGGTVGVNVHGLFLGDTPTLDTLCDHIFHFLDLSGSDKHISLGSDFDGCEVLPAEVSGVQDYDKLADRLINRGLSVDTVENIFWNNALGVIEKCSM